MMERRPIRHLAAACLLMFGTTADAAEPIDELLAPLVAVGAQGQGNLAAATAVEALSRRGPEVLPAILRAFESAGPISANYLRGAFESIADRAVRGGDPLPVKALEAFVLDRRRNARARRLAYEWLVRVDRSAPERLIPGMLDDPGPEFRREAVQRLIDKAQVLVEQKKSDVARKTYRTALQGAVHDDQVQAIVGPLRTMGETIDLPAHFGFITRWRVIGPFDNRDGKGFGAVYPPEKAVDFDADYTAQPGKVLWKPIETEHDYGIVNIAQQISPYKGAVMYAAAEFQSEAARRIEVRLGTPNAWKLWINGRLMFAREEYHRDMALDQYRVRADLQEGRNLLLLKLCQNEQDEDWAQRYQFQLRVCDASGTAVLSADRPLQE